MKPGPPSPAVEVAPVPGDPPGASSTECWSTVGVFGSGTCPELPRAVHCRNCPIFARAGAAFLDRPLPEHYRKEWAEHFARGREVGQPGNVSAVIFRIQTEWFALPTHCLQEITERRVIHSLPHWRAGHILGVANVRGELVLCVSLGHALGLSGMPPHPQVRISHSRLLVTSWNARGFGFPVDEVGGIERFQTQDLRPAASTPPGLPCVQGAFSWEHWTVSVLNLDLLFSTLQEGLA